jgi:tetratricopeptide (TPR) repeat protein
MNRRIKNVVIGALFLFGAFQSIAQQNDNDLRAAFKRSYESEALVKYAKAIEELAPYASLNSYEVQLRLGWLNYLNIKYAQAAVNYKKCIELAPKSIEARMGYVYTLASLEKWNDVVDQYKEIIKIDPSNAKANYSLALIYFNRADYTTALSYINTYVALYPFDFDGVNLAGWIKYNLGKKEEAVPYFKKALLLNPSLKTYDAVLGLK